MVELKLSEIYIYPVKSLAGIKVDTWTVVKTGLLYDRHWMIIDDNNQFLTQRQIPSMALIQTQIHNQQLHLSTASDTISLPLNSTDTTPLHTTIWLDQCLAHPVAHEANQWISDILHHSCRLVYQASEIRQVDPLYAEAGDQAAFSDGFPFLIISQQSLEDLNQAMDKPISMQRFRPNLVISGSSGYAEDSWRNINISNIDFRLPKPCSRCAIPTIDLKTGKTGKEPLKTLNRLRKWKKEVFFGQNALHDQTGQLKTGDPVSILKTGNRQPPL